MSQLKTYSVPTVVVPAMKAAAFAGGSAGTFAVGSVETHDRILFVLSFDSQVAAESSGSGTLSIPLVGLGDAFTRTRSTSSASIPQGGAVGLDYSTASYYNIVFFIDSSGASVT